MEGYYTPAPMGCKMRVSGIPEFYFPACQPAESSPVTSAPITGKGPGQAANQAGVDIAFHQESFQFLANEHRAGDSFIALFLEHAGQQTLQAQRKPRPFFS